MGVAFTAGGATEIPLIPGDEERGDDATGAAVGIEVFCGGIILRPVEAAPDGGGVVEVEFTGL